MEKLVLLGDEAVAQGALDAGLSGVYAYPGTPSSEITGYIQHNAEAIKRNVHREWCVNEKTAMEAALGMSYAGKRALVCMKHVGLNVAADPYINSALTGANGGIVVAVADDPSMHSSQNEQDSRFYGKFAMLPVMEPSNQQEAYDMIFYAFDLSEQYKIPILVRVTTRLAHSRSGIERKPVRPENTLKLPEDPNQFMLLPAIARKRYKGLLETQTYFEQESEKSPFNIYHEGSDTTRGIIACGLAYNYLMENYQEHGCSHPILKISQYPLPRTLIEKITAECDEILVLEEGAPFVEEMLTGYLGNRFNGKGHLDVVGTEHGKISTFSKHGLSVKGRLDGTVPRDGELNPSIVRVALGMGNTAGRVIPDIVVRRPPALCKGCPHIDTYNALNTALEGYGKGHVFSDIGCYTLGFLPPYNAINSCVDMGASVTMAKGAADAGLFPSIAVIGDSTFTHSGITGLLDAVHEKSNVVIIILDNGTTAMTGGQATAATGRLENICRGLGVEAEHIRVLNPLKKNHAEMVRVMKEEIEYNSVSVIIPRRDCLQTLKKKK
jgi:indolepyruvate ferredoxin oxidoreductase alpha subunit